MNENREYIKNWALEIEKYADRKMYKCPVCGEFFEIDEELEEVRYPNCGSNEYDVEDFEIADLWDYFEDHEFYDVEYRVGGNGAYRSVKIMIACGGPNVFIDTKDCYIRLYWGADFEEYPISYSVGNQLDEYFEELYACVR